MTTTTISCAQQKILNQAPRFRLYYDSGDRPGLIPDTAKARAWAVEKCGANHMNSLTFHRAVIDGKAYCVGDCHILVADKDEAQEFKTNNYAVTAKDVAFRAKKLLSSVFDAENPNCRCTYISSLVIGISISSGAFAMQEGAFFLSELYEEAATRLSVHAAGFGLQVSYRPIAKVENTLVEAGVFATPFLLDEASRLHPPLEQLAASPRVVPNVNCEWQIEPTVLAEMKRKAVDRWGRRPRKAWTTQPSEPDRLIESDPAHLFNSMHVTAAQRCARKLVNWIRRNSLTEFGQRDAVRAARKRLRGPSGDGEGVADALKILVGARYIYECPEPVMEYFCKRPSPWFLVNPLL